MTNLKKKIDFLEKSIFKLIFYFSEENKISNCLTGLIG